MPPESRTTPELQELIKQGMVPFHGEFLDGDDMIALVTGMLGEVAHPEYVTVMVDQTGRGADYEGVSGFRDAMGDFISPYETYGLRIDEMIPTDNAMVLLVTQRGVTKHGSVEVESPGASVWWLEDGLIRQAVFYIDQRAALEAAGVDRDQS